MSQRFVVVYEARADFVTASEPADRVFLAEIDWLDETLLDSQRQWVGQDQPGELLTWTSIPRRAQELGIKVHGHFNGEPGFADARAARRALAYVLRRHEGEAPGAILLIRDMDDQGERRTSEGFVFVTDQDRHRRGRSRTGMLGDQRISAGGRR